MTTQLTADQRLEKIDKQLEQIAKAVVTGFANADKNVDDVRDDIKKQIDIYARAVDAYAKQAKAYMQKMLALGAKVDRLERQIEQIAKHLHLKLEY